MTDDAPTADADRGAMLSEAYKRGLLPPDMKAPYEEAMKRGLVPSGAGPASDQLTFDAGDGKGTQTVKALRRAGNGLGYVYEGPGGQEGRVGNALVLTHPNLPEASGAEKFIATPIARGLSNTAGLPRAVGDLIREGGYWVTNKLGGSTPPVYTKGAPVPSASDVHGGIQKVADLAGINTDATAETAGGRIAQGALAGAVGGAALPFGGALTSVTSGLLGGAGAEAAGEATHGTKFEPYARFAAGLIAGGTPILAQHVLMSRAGAELRNSIGNLTPQQMQEVERRLANATTAGGDPNLLVTEAIQAVTGPNRRLATIQNVAESNAPADSALARTITNRSANNTAAFDQAIDRVAPPIADPHMIAPRVQAAAETSINNERDAINAQARPFYDASRPTMIPAPEFDALRSNPSFAKALKQVRGNAELNGRIAHLPDNSVGVVDAVKKHLNTMAENVSVPATGRGNRNLVGLRSEAEGLARDAGVANSPMYAKALDIGAEGRQTVLEPLQRSALGKLSKSDDLVAQANALMDPKAVTLTPKQIRETISRLSMHDPEATQNLVRRAIEVRFNEINQDLTGAANAYGGAKFRADIAGNREQAANLEALIRSLPKGDQAWSGFKNLLETFQAQGFRMPIGSTTAEKTEIIKQLAAGRLGAPINFAARGFWRSITDAAERRNLATGSQQIGDAIASKDGLDALRQLSFAAPTSERAAGLALRVIGAK